MGRELKRVALDFQWPLHKLWKGYKNPHFRPCPKEDTECFGGYTAAGRWLEAVGRHLGMMGTEAAEPPPHPGQNRIYPHPYLRDWPCAPQFGLPRELGDRIRAEDDQAQRNWMLHDHWRRNPPKVLPLTEELLNFVEGLTGEPVEPFPGSILGYKIQKALLKAAGMPESFGICPVCDGDAMDPAAKTAYEAWTEEEPPAGEGFQLWETTSAGSPISPVFRTLEDLCAWAETGASPMGVHQRISAAEWFEMLRGDFVSYTDPKTGLTFV